MGWLWRRCLKFIPANAVSLPTQRKLKHAIVQLRYANRPDGWFLGRLFRQFGRVHILATSGCSRERNHDCCHPIASRVAMVHGRAKWQTMRQR